MTTIDFNYGEAHRQRGSWGDRRAGIFHASALQCASVHGYYIVA
jgi:hypothetical protein